MPQHTWLRTLAEQIEDSCQSLLPSSWFVLSVLFSTFFICLFSLSLSYKTISKSRADPARLQLSEQAKGPGDVQCAKQSGDGNARTACTTANLQSLQRKNANLKRCKANILKGFDVKERKCEKRSRNGTPWHSSINARVSPILTGVTVAQIALILVCFELGKQYIPSIWEKRECVL